ncbi:MAG: ROK family protein, partial [Polyangiaceae bacterium]|nr:ROK family protein [Polyangiaceae bacterium]
MDRSVNHDDFAELVGYLKVDSGAMNQDDGFMIGVDFGGTSIKVALVEGGRILRSTDVPTPASEGPEAVLDAIARGVLEIETNPRSVGVAIPGEVDGEGVCWGLPNVPGFRGVALNDGLTARLRCPVAVENDATTAALGEFKYGHGRNYPSFLMVTLGTGIGGGLVIGGELYPGSNGFGGEIGHINIDPSPDAPLCGCGKRGCVEAFAGTAALIREYQRNGGPLVSEIKPISEAARAGDEAAKKTWHQMGRAVGLGLSGIQNTLDLNAIVFTGGISRSFDLLEAGVREGLKERCFAIP